ncbi:putative histone H1 [Phytophthora cinnamomi]|uniref:putative histone H1 n=1 Tax=Phytophthora cinnamomi TaxID=4785 RepID=UPI0035594CAC|nr:putative histone H1 [Phytophthora cinnamomi]
MPSAPSTKKANAGPGYYDLIKAVLSLKERSGSSRMPSTNYVAAKKGASYSKGSFKLAAEEKKVAAKARHRQARPQEGRRPGQEAAAKKPAAKKPAAKVCCQEPATKEDHQDVKTTKTAKARRQEATKATKKVSAKAHDHQEESGEEVGGQEDHQGGQEVSYARAQFVQYVTSFVIVGGRGLVSSP